MKIPFQVNLSDKVVAITGAGGIICSEFAKALAECGAKVALLDINFDAAKKYADEIGENAMPVKCNCLDKNSIIQAKQEINAKWGKVNFLINGAGGNNPRASTDNETMTPDLEGVKDFFAFFGHFMSKGPHQSRFARQLPPREALGASAPVR